MECGSRIGWLGLWGCWGEFCGVVVCELGRSLRGVRKGEIGMILNVEV